MFKKKRKDEPIYDTHEFDLSPILEREYIYNESQRISKGKFNIFDINSVENAGNPFVATLVFLLVCFFLCGIGIGLLYFDFLPQNLSELVSIFVLMPIFGLITFFAGGIKIFRRAKKVFYSGKAYLVYIDYESFWHDCILCIDCKIIKRSTIRGCSLKNCQDVFVIYSKEFDQLIFLNPKNSDRFSVGNEGYFAEEDEQVKRYIEKINRLD